MHSFVRTAHGNLAHGEAPDSNREHVRRHRDLLFLNKKSVVSIDSPLNGALIPATTTANATATQSNAEMEVVVSFKNGGIFTSFSSLELLKDSKVVATKKVSKSSGKETFRMDTTVWAHGTPFKLQARGVFRRRLFQGRLLGRRPRSVQSKEITVTLEAPPPTTNVTKAPTKSPTKSPKPPVSTDTVINTTACRTNHSFLYFPGLDEAISAERGMINLTWSPAFAMGYPGANLLWCGKLSYDVFLADSATFNFSDLNATVPELVERGKLLGLKRVETTALSIILRDLEPDAVFSILVTAKTTLGHYSFNRDKVQIKVATTDPIVNKKFTRMVNLPDTNGTVFQITKVAASNTLIFSGSQLPTEVETLRPLDFVYFIDASGNASMAQLLTKTSNTSSGGGGVMGAVTWTYGAKTLKDVFDELDVSGDVVNPSYNRLDRIKAYNRSKVLSDAEYNALDINIKINLCLVAFPGEEGTDLCVAASFVNRRLGFWDFDWVVDICVWVGGVLVTAAEAVVEGIKYVGEFALDLLFRGVTGGANAKLLDVSESAKLTIGSGSLESGFKFTASSSCSFTITLSIIKAIHRAELRLYGGFGLDGYIYLADRYRANVRPDALKLFEKEYRYQFFVGPIPVWITFRPTVSAFAELAVEAEGRALITTSPYYTYSFTFGFNQARSGLFYTTGTVLPGPTRDKNDGGIQVRLNAAAEVGITFGFAVLLYDLLQGSVATDLGLRTELDVGTNVEAIAITTPYFYTLNRFDVDVFVRCRAYVGLNTNLADLLQKFFGSGSLAGVTFGRSSYRVPSLPSLLSSLPAPLQKALDKARADPIFQDATSLSMAQFSSLEPNDPYKGSRPAIAGMDRNFGFGLSATLFSKDFSIVTLPSIALVKNGLGSEGQICSGNNAIEISIDYVLTNSHLYEDSARWFTNFDGKIFKESTGWTISSSRSNRDKVTLSLPRSVISSPGFSFYQLDDAATIYLRVTPKVLPFPKYNMFVKAPVKTLLRDPIPKFECCDDADCHVLYTKNVTGKSVCGEDRMCRQMQRLTAQPGSMYTNEKVNVTLAVNLAGLNATGVDSFMIWRMNEFGSQMYSSAFPIYLYDDGSGKDKVAKDKIYSNAVALLTTVPQSYHFYAVPVINGTISYYNTPLRLELYDGVTALNLVPR